MNAESLQIHSRKGEMTILAPLGIPGIPLEIWNS
jgi:hypothetical protein